MMLTTDTLNMGIISSNISSKNTMRKLGIGFGVRGLPPEGEAPFSAWGLPPDLDR